MTSFIPLRKPNNVMHDYGELISTVSDAVVPQ